MEILNVIAAAVAAFAFGAVWYITMGAAWARAAGVPVDAAGKPVSDGGAMPFVIGLVAMVIVAGMMRHIFATTGVATLGAGIIGGFGIGAFLITPWVAMNYAFAGRPASLTLIDSVNAVVGCAIMGAVLTLF
jgi:hypothetical protein